MKICVYDDSLAFGGHQFMACRGMEALAEDPALDVVAIFNPGNRDLARTVSAVPNVKAVECMDASRPFQGIRNPFSRQRIQHLEKQFHALQPDMVLCIQGDIEQSSIAFPAARRAGIDCISYIAIPHRLSDMGATLGRLRDLYNYHLLNQPDRYITISNSMKKILMERGVTKPVAVVANGIPIPPSESRRPQTKDMTLGLFGRIEFKQKAQDFMVNAFCRHQDAFRGCRLLMAGKGPDEEKLRRLIAASPCHDRITLLPWQNDVDSLYEQIDILMLPSRYEGVPLVMLEALARGIPVFGSARDGMKELLPAPWLFRTGDAVDMVRTFRTSRDSWTDAIDAVRQKVSAEMNIDAFKAAFRRAVLQR